MSADFLVDTIPLPSLGSQSGDQAGTAADQLVIALTDLMPDAANQIVLELDAGTDVVLATPIPVQDEGVVSDETEGFDSALSGMNFYRLESGITLISDAELHFDALI